MVSFFNEYGERLLQSQMQKCLYGGPKEEGEGYEE